MSNQNIPSKPLALVAEDDPVSFHYQNSILKEMGFSVIHAVNGKLAVDLFQQNPSISIILMDINMPVMDGIEATRQIKSLHNPPPIIMVTAYNAQDIREKANGSGCNDYIHKPIIKHDYVRRIKKLVPV